MLSLAAMLFPFVMPWDDGSPTAPSLRHLQSEPAGIHEFIQAHDGHLYTGDQRLRLVGMNFSFSANLPATHRDAEAIAARLAKFGINCVRLMLLDTKPAPEGLLKPDHRTLDKSALEKLDYFVHQLKQNGIYVAIPLYVGRRLPALDSELSAHPSYYGGAEFFDPGAIADQKQYARALLHHRNPFTGLRYADDPAVAYVEIINENGFAMAWWKGAWERADLPFRNDLERRWKAWLKQRYSSDERLRAAWQPLAPSADLLAGAGDADPWETWQLHSGDGGHAVVVPAEPSGETINLSVTRPGAKLYSIQFFRDNVEIKGDTLDLRFAARGDKHCTISAVVAQTAPYKTLHEERVAITDEWQDHAFVFTPLKSVGPGRVTFTGLSACEGAVQLRHVSLRPGGGTGLVAGETPDSIGLVSRSGFARRTLAVQRDWLDFLEQIEAAYYDVMRRFLVDELHVKSLLVGTQQNYSPRSALAGMDITDMHGYWDTQRRVGKQVYEMRNRPQAGDVHGGVLGLVSPYRIDGRPFIVSEYNYRGANTYSSEADLMMLAYASLHDWDGVFIFNYANNNGFEVDRLIGDEGFNGHSNRFVSLVPAALMFRRGDVAPSREPITLCIPDGDVRDHMRRFGPAPSAWHLGLEARTALQHGLSILAGKRECPPAENPAVPPAGKPIVSDTGELTWDPGKDGRGLFMVNTPNTKILAGYADQRSFKLGNITVALGQTTQGWAAVTLTRLDGDRNQSARWLITATGMSRNADMRFLNPERTRYTWGHKPVEVEGVPATITIPMSPDRLALWALDEKGGKRRRIPVTDHPDGQAHLTLGPQYRTVWYLLESN